MKFVFRLMIIAVTVAACNGQQSKQESSNASEAKQTVDSSSLEAQSKIDAAYRIFAWGGLFRDDAKKEYLEIRSLFKFRSTGILYYNFMVCTIEGKPALSIDYCGDKALMEEYRDEKEGLDGEFASRKFDQTFPTQTELIFSEKSLAAEEQNKLTNLLNAEGEALIPVYLSEIIRTNKTVLDKKTGKETLLAGNGRKLKKGKGWVTRNF